MISLKQYISRVVREDAKAQSKFKKKQLCSYFEGAFLFNVIS